MVSVEDLEVFRARLTGGGRDNAGDDGSKGEAELSFVDDGEGATPSLALGLKLE